MGSTRLPGKVLARIGDSPMLAIIVERLKPSKRIDQLVIATTLLEADDSLEALARELGVACFRGSESDLLERYHSAAREFSAEVVARLTGDNPLVDADFIDHVIDEYAHLQPPVDYLTTHGAGFPVGLHVEVFSFRALEKAWREDGNSAWREHVTPYMYKTRGLFTVGQVDGEGDYSHLRWTVDTPEDLEFIRKVFCHFGRYDFSWRDVVGLLEKHPDWLDMNRHIQQRAV
ncbi:glycosyltransferase family protein [Candidatus Poribacteria bacterium]|nr:glycosyltransferase family protein [Candidatus Poribacteria bacterium]